MYMHNIGIDKRYLLMFLLTAVALRSGVASYVVASSSSQDEAARKRLRAKLIKYEAAYEKYEAELTDEQKNICQAQLDVIRAKIDRRDDQELLRLYKCLQDLIVDEAKRVGAKQRKACNKNRKEVF